MNYEGTVVKIMDAQRISEKFVKREFVVSDKREKYPQLIIFETQNSNCSLVDGIKEGDDVDVHFHIRGREWKNPQGVTKYFLTLVATEILKYQSNESNSSSNDKSSSDNNQSNSRPVTTNDDLPF